MKRVFQYISGLNLFGVFCAADCLYRDKIGLFGGIVLMFLFLGLFVLFAYLGGMFYKR